MAMLMTGLLAGFVLGMAIMAAVAMIEWERGFRAAGGRAGRDHVVRERLAARALGRAA